MKRRDKHRVYTDGRKTFDEQAEELLQKYMDMDNHIELLKNKIHELFEKEDIGKCADRFCNTMFYVSEKDDRTYTKNLLIRLLQGGVEL